jgi:uncharacterized membrane-anchored protein
MPDRTPRSRTRALAALFALAFASLPAESAEPVAETDAGAAPPQLAWQQGPLTAPIGDSLAEIDVPEGYAFLGLDDTAKLLELMQNPVTGSELATLAPTSEQESWLLIFEWEPIGWVDDSEKDDLDADALLASIQQGTRESNEERKRRGWSTVEIVGWHEKPHYDEQTRNLTWAIEGISDGQRVLNRMVKLLGRRGVMTVTIVTSPDEVVAAAGATDGLLGGYRFQQGSSYAEYVPGKDKLASYGLTALVAGGLGAAALKSGLLGKLWKVLAVAVVGAGAWIRRLFTGRKHIADPPTPV